MDASGCSRCDCSVAGDTEALFCSQCGHARGEHRVSAASPTATATGSPALSTPATRPSFLRARLQAFRGEARLIVGAVLGTVLLFGVIGVVVFVAESHQAEDDSVREAYDNGYSLAQSLDDGYSSSSEIISACESTLYAASSSNQGIEATYTSDQSDAYLKGCKEGAPSGGGATPDDDGTASSSSGSGAVPSFPPLQPSLDTSMILGVGIGDSREDVETVWGSPPSGYEPSQNADDLAGDIAAYWNSNLTDDPACSAELTFRDDAVAKVRIYPCFYIDTGLGPTVTAGTSLATVQAAYPDGQIMVDPPLDAPDAIYWVVQSEIPDYSLVFETAASDEFAGTRDPTHLNVFQIGLVPTSEIKCGLDDGSRGACVDA